MPNPAFHRPRPLQTRNRRSLGNSRFNVWGAGVPFPCTSLGISQATKEGQGFSDPWGGGGLGTPTHCGIFKTCPLEKNEILNRAPTKPTQNGLGPTHPPPSPRRVGRTPRKTLRRAGVRLLRTLSLAMRACDLPPCRPRNAWAVKRPRPGRRAGRVRHHWCPGKSGFRVGLSTNETDDVWR